MSGISERTKRVYYACVPAKIRDSLGVTWLKSKILGANWRHNAVYTASYYADEVEGAAVRSSATIADSIVSEYGAKRVVDVGCGTGALLEMLRSRGCEVLGFDYSDAAISYCNARGLNVTKFDLETNTYEASQAFDVAISLEVAEHLPESVADRYVNFLCRLAPIVVFTAAPPGQGGADHVNEQPASYWIEKFGGVGYGHLEQVSQKWRDKWQMSGTVESWYWKNLMIFGRVSGL